MASAILGNQQEPRLSTQPGATLSVRDLELARGDRQLFAGLGFELGAGQLALVTGPNGAGKTTLLRTLAGLRPPAAGSVTFGGISVARLSRALVAPIAYQGHQDGLKRDLTVAENLAFVANLWQAAERPMAAATELGLTDCFDRPVRYLSAGQRRRAALGCLQLRQAALWLLDEPLTNLDASGAELVTTWLVRHLEGAGAAVVATHQPERLAAHATLTVEL
jgi:heme exporter protein A